MKVVTERNETTVLVMNDGTRVFSYDCGTYLSYPLPATGVWAGSAKATMLALASLLRTESARLISHAAELDEEAAKC